MSRLETHQSAAAAMAPSPASAHVAVRVITPAKRRLRVADLWYDIPVVRVLAARDFKVKYKQSALGPLWLLFQPLALLAAFMVAFRNLAGVETAGIPYMLFALSGLAVWAFFQAAMTMGTVSLISNYHLVRLTPCPRLAFPVASLVASLPALAVTAAAALVVALVTGHISPRVVLLPLAAAWLFLLTAGVVAAASAVTVRFRDIQNGLPFLLQLGVFVSPVGYPRDAVGGVARVIVDLNPLTGVIELWRWMIISGYHLATRPLITAAAWTVLLLVGGWRLFARLEVSMADDI